MKNKGQTELSFGMIFSIMLIIVFLVLGFYIIYKFVGMSGDLNIETFTKNLQEDIDRMWSSPAGSWSPPEGYLADAKVEKICFIDLNGSATGTNKDLFREIDSSKAGRKPQSMVFLPLKELNYLTRELEHLNFEKTTAVENPYCIDGRSGRFFLTVEKEIYANNVIIKRQ